MKIKTLFFVGLFVLAACHRSTPPAKGPGLMTNLNGTLDGKSASLQIWKSGDRLYGYVTTPKGSTWVPGGSLQAGRLFFGPLVLHSEYDTIRRENIWIVDSGGIGEFSAD